MDCECGCGVEVLSGRRFRRGHNRRGHRWSKPLDETAYEIRDCGFVTPCWDWVRGHTSLGYGIAWDPRIQKHRSAYRMMYEQLIGSVPDGLELDHLCENPSCVNPAHLEPVPHAVNIRRSRRAKLTMEIAAEIRRLHGEGRSKRGLAKQFGVTRPTILAVINGVSWI